MAAQILHFPDGTIITTDIDRRYCTREVPMKVLALGMCRTGSLSLVKALKTLGYSHAYHSNDTIFTNPQDCELWLEALRAKFDGKGKVWGREEFDRLLGHCQAVCDIPAICFAEDLIEAYPEAKVILTIRNVDEWHKSAESTINAMLKHPLFPLFNILDKILHTRTRLVRLAFQKAWNTLFEGNFESNGHRVFEEHYKKIQALVPPERLLIYRVKDGWEPLCEFLNQPIPDTPMPHENEAALMRLKLQKVMLYNLRQNAFRLLDIVSRAALVVLVVSVVCGDGFVGLGLAAFGRGVWEGVTGVMGRLSCP